MAKLSDEELKVIVDAELELSYVGGDLSGERSTGMDRYLGEPLGTEMEGRSQVHTRDVMETIEWIMPTLITIFTDSDSAVDIEPVGEEDEEAAEQETDYINHIFYKKNDGFLILYSWFKDALLSKNGVTKCFVDEDESVTKHNYENLTDVELQSLLSDPEIELIEHTPERRQFQTNDGMVVEIEVHDVLVSRTKNNVDIVIENVPPEEFIVSKDARSPNPKNARFKAHRTTKTVSELRAVGYSQEDIETMEFGDSAVSLSEETLSRYHLADEEQFNDIITQNTGMRKVKIDECYLLADRDGDGVAERLKIVRSGDFIEVEEIDYDPFNSLTPIILTHKYYGLSIADIMSDLQEIRTMLFRGYMDNIHQTINGKTYYDENTVNLDDMLTSKPYGLVANDGPPGQAVFVDRPSGLPAEAYSLNDLLDKFQHNRIGDIQSQLDPSVLAQANTGVVLSMLNEAKAKVYMVARIFAEVGMKPLFRDIHHLAKTYADQEEIVKLKNNWIPVNPKSWQDRTDFTVKVGLGIKGRQEGIADIQSLIEMQTSMLERGVPMVTPQNLYMSAREYAERLGYMPEKYFTDPQMIPPPPPEANPQQDILRLTAEIEKAKLEQKLIETNLKNERATEQNLIKAKEAEVKELSVQLEQVDRLIKEREISINEETEQFKQITMAAHAVNESTQLELDKYKADLAAQVDLLVNEERDRSNRLIAEFQEKAKLIAAQEKEQSSRLIAELQAEIEDFHAANAPRPKQIVYDADGRIVQVGNKRVKRDGDGRAIAIE